VLVAGDAASKLPPTFEGLYAEIASLRPGLTGEILEPGVLRTIARPGAAHRHAQKRLVIALGSKDVGQGGRGWWNEIEAEVRLLEDRLVVPDLAGSRSERVPKLPDENPITITPDWCCEILSPSTARDDRRIKLPLYASAGVPHVWLVDTERRLVEVFETRAGKPTLIATAAESEICTLIPFEDVSIDLAPLWRVTGA
jgi:Uma2 family endonuclease